MLGHTSNASFFVHSVSAVVIVHEVCTYFWMRKCYQDREVNGADKERIWYYNICICFLFPDTNMNVDIVQILNLLSNKVEYRFSYGY